MQRQTLFIASLIACLVGTSTALALTMGYGRRDIAEAGAGCVGGWVSGHGNTAYFRGDAETLNRQLKSLSAAISEYRSVKVVLHAGEKLVDNPEEQPLTGLGDETRNQLAIDWSVRKTCPLDDVLAGRCKCDRQRLVTVDIWIANEIRLETLSIPPGLQVEPVTLIGTIVKWRYTGAEIGKSKMSDAATIAADGKRTAPSTVLTTTMVTSDSVDKVLAFYRDLLTRNPENDGKLGIEPKLGRSVVISDESEDRPFAFHTILVNSANTSTTLIITRGTDEETTRITWKQYLRHDIGD